MKLIPVPNLSPQSEPDPGVRITDCVALFNAAARCDFHLGHRYGAEIYVHPEAVLFQFKPGPGVHTYKLHHGAKSQVSLSCGKLATGLPGLRGRHELHEPLNPPYSAVVRLSAPLDVSGLDLLDCAVEAEGKRLRLLRKAPRMAADVPKAHVAPPRIRFNAAAGRLIDALSWNDHCQMWLSDHYVRLDFCPEADGRTFTLARGDRGGPFITSTALGRLMNLRPGHYRVRPVKGMPCSLSIRLDDPLEP